MGRVGEEYDETTLDGRDVRTLVQFKDEKIHIDEKPRNEKSVGAHILHELETPDIMVQSMWKTGKFLTFKLLFSRLLIRSICQISFHLTMYSFTTFNHQSIKNVN